MSKHSQLQNILFLQYSSSELHAGLKIQLLGKIPLTDVTHIFLIVYEREKPGSVGFLVLCSFPKTGMCVCI